MKNHQAKPIALLSRYEILDELLKDNFDINPLDAAEVSETIQQAARANALIWTQEHIISTLHNRPLTLTR